MKPQVPSLFAQNQNITDKFSLSERIVVYPGDCLEMLRTIPAESMQLIVTSPPYNIGKEYEKRLHLDVYLRQQEQVIAECVRTCLPRRCALRRRQEGTLRTRPMDRPVYEPVEAGNSLVGAPWKKNTDQSTLFERSPKYGKTTK